MSDRVRACFPGGHQELVGLGLVSSHGPQPATQLAPRGIQRVGHGGEPEVQVGPGLTLS